MARYDDNSPYVERWTNAKLIREARRMANLTDFSVGFYSGVEVTFKEGWTGQTGSPEVADFIREQTRSYRETWLKPVLDEIERRFVKAKS